MPVLLPRGRSVHPIVRANLRRDVDCIELEVEVAVALEVVVDVTDDQLTVDVDEC